MNINYIYGSFILINQVLLKRKLGKINSGEIINEASESNASEQNLDRLKILLVNQLSPSNQTYFHVPLILRPLSIPRHIHHGYTVLTIENIIFINRAIFELNI